MELKKRLLLIFIITIIGLVTIQVIPINKNNNWEVELINGYSIKKNSDTDIKLLKNKEEIVTDYIGEYSYGKRYILLKCVKSTETINIVFYIIDTEKDEIYGPYNDYVTYEVIRDEIVDEKVNDFIKTLE